MKDLPRLEINGDPAEFLQPLPNLKELGLPMQPFYIVRATALDRLDWIKTLIGERNVEITREFPITQFDTLARHIYPVIPDKARTFIWLMMNRVITPETYDLAHALLLHPRHLNNYMEEVDGTKRYVRDVIGVDWYDVVYEGEHYEADLHHVHAPYYKDVAFEFNALMNFAPARL